MGVERNLRIAPVSPLRQRLKIGLPLHCRSLPGRIDAPCNTFAARLALMLLGRNIWCPARLLHHMGELVSQKTLAFIRCGRILTRPEDDVRPNGIRAGTHPLRRFRRTSIRMDPHLAEVVTEAWLHCGAGLWREGVAASPGPLADKRQWIGVDWHLCRRLPCKRQLASCARIGRIQCQCSGFLMHHLLGHTVCLLLGGITGLADSELRLRTDDRYLAEVIARGRILQR